MTVDPTQFLIAGIRQGTRAAHIFFDRDPGLSESRQVGLVCIQYCPGPLDPAWLEHPIEHAWGWPTVREDMGNHVGHVLLTCPEPENGSVLEQMLQMVQVAGNILEWPGAMAYLWVEGAALHRADAVRSYLSELNQETGAFPLDLWVGVRLFRDEGEGSILLDTLGMHAFERRDLEIFLEDTRELSEEALGALQELLRRSALYIVLRGEEVVGERHLLEFPDGSTCSVVDGVSQIFPERKIWRLVPIPGGDPPVHEGA
ncbi:MAG: hypothetical protein QF752_08260 [Planctomycetota bacterium]|jgi:hypothetical protein|nr:hypothetical protein [Planctomycetota bacterium]